MLNRYIIMACVIISNLYSFEVPGIPNCVLPDYEEHIVSKSDKIDIMNMITDTKMNSIKRNSYKNVDKEIRKEIECKVILESYKRYMIKKGYGK